MADIDLTDVGVHVASNSATFGIYLPGITAALGFGVNVRLIHALDQFVPEIPSQVMPLTFDPASPLGLWQATVDIGTMVGAGGKGSHFGQPGEYLYRFELWRNGILITQHFSDPFALRVGPGFLGSFDLGPVVPFPWSDATYKTPALDELIVYELQIEEFNATFDGVVARLDYLQGLGVNCLEIMPVNPIKKGFDWGYGPTGYFATESVFGGNQRLQNLVDACHARGIAVILDVVFGHAAADDFPYARVYDDSGVSNPMMQTPNRDHFGRGIEWSFTFTQEYFAAVTQHWLDEYHVDGFRYDNVPGYYDGPTGTGYAKLAYGTYVYSKTIPRFSGPAYSRIIQCAEDLDQPQQILQQTYTAATWQDLLLNKTRDMVYWKYVDDSFAHLLDPSFSGYPAAKDASGAGDQPFSTAPFQYLETHDHSRFIASFGLDLTDNGELQFGNRDLYYKTQAYAIALMTSAGVPLLFQGQEFAENYVIPGDGNGRTGIRRGVHWEYFYDEAGQPLVKLYRRLGKLRRALPALRSRDFFYFNTLSSLSDGVIVYSRTAADPASGIAQIAMIAVNFSDTDRNVTIVLPTIGTYTELLDAPNVPTPQTFTAASTGQQVTVSVKSNYGVILVSPGPALI